MKKLTRVLPKAVMLIIGAFLFFDALLLILLSNIHIGHFITLAAGAVFLFFGLAYEKIYKNLPAWLKLIFYLCIGTAVIFMLFLLIYGACDNVGYTEDAVVILGAGIHGEEPSENLKRRLDTAVRYYEKNRDAVFVVSGGQGPQEDITEAKAMKRYLTEHAIPSEQIICEELATSTEENFANSKVLLDGCFTGEYSVAFITNDYHIYRAESTALDEGYCNITHMHSNTPWYALIPSIVRECLAVAKAWVFG